MLRLVPLEFGKVEEGNSAVLGLDLHNAGGEADGGLLDEHGILACLRVGTKTEVELRLAVADGVELVLDVGGVFERTRHLVEYPIGLVVHILVEVWLHDTGIEVYPRLEDFFGEFLLGKDFV